MRAQAEGGRCEDLQLLPHLPTVRKEAGARLCEEPVVGIRIDVVWRQTAEFIKWNLRRGLKAGILTAVHQ